MSKYWVTYYDEELSSKYNHKILKCKGDLPTEEEIDSFISRVSYGNTWEIIFMQKLAEED